MRNRSASPWRWCRRRLLVLAVMVLACGGDPEPVQPHDPATVVPATVASFRVVSKPDGAETIERIAVSESGLVRFPDEKGSWRLFDISAREVVVVDQIGRTVRRETFDEALNRLHRRVRQSSTAPPLILERASATETVAGFETSLFRFTMGRGYEREMWISKRPLVHSDLFLLRLATDPVADEDLPSLRPLVDLIDELDGYPVVDQSRMSFDGVDYEIERRLLAVATRNVPASWFQLPDWDAELRGPRAGHQPAASPLAGQNAREEGSRSFGSDQTDP